MGIIKWDENEIIILFLWCIRPNFGLTENPLHCIKPPGQLLFFQAHLRGRGGGLFEREGLHAFNLEKTMISVLHKELQCVEYKVENLMYKKVGGHAAEDQNQIRTSSKVNPQQSPWVPIYTLSEERQSGVKFLD